MVDDTHTAWVERMAQLMAPASTSRPGTLNGSMESLQRQIEHNCRKLGSPGPQSQEASPPAALRVEEATVARAASPKVPGLSSDVPGPLGEQLTGFMERLKEDLSKDLVRQLAALSKSDREDQDRKTAELFESVEQERRKIERLEDRLIYGAAPTSPPHARRSHGSAAAARLSQEQQEELLPLLDQIERTILTDCSLAASGRPTVVTAAPRAPPAWQPPPPAGPPPARFAAASTGGGGGGGGGGGMSRRHSREVEDRKRHFNASFGSSQPTLPPPPPGARFAGGAAGAAGGFDRETESVCSRSSATSGRREVVEPHTLRQHLGWQTRESPPPPPPPPGPPPPQAGPPPQHPHAASPYLKVVGGRVPPRGGDGYARQPQQPPPPPPPPGPPPSHYMAPPGPPPQHPPSDLYENAPHWDPRPHAGPSDELVEHQSCYSPGMRRPSQHRIWCPVVMAFLFRCLIIFLS